MPTKRALTFVPPSQRAAKLKTKPSPASPSRPATGVRSMGNVKGIRESVDKALRAPKAPAHPDNVATSVASQAKSVEKAAEGVQVLVRDEEAVLVLGSLLDARDKALKAAEEASAEGKEADADQLLAKAVGLESICERLGRAFVERRMGKK